MHKLKKTIPIVEAKKHARLSASGSSRWTVCHAAPSREDGRPDKARDPMSAAPCGVGLTCYYSVSDAEFDCVKTTKLGVGATCNFADDCDKGLVCVGDGAGSSHCQRWCHPVDDVFPSVFCGSFFEGTNYCLGVAVQVASFSVR